MLVVGLVVGVLADQQIQAKLGHDDLEKIYQDLQQCDESKVGELLLRVTQEDIDSILAAAAQCSVEKIVIRLLPKAKDVNYALNCAARNGHEKIVDMLLPRVKDVDYALGCAAENGHEKIIARLLPKAENVDYALECAAKNGHEKIVDMLLPRVKDVNYALGCAAKNGHEKLVAWLLPKAENVDNALEWAVIKNHEKIFEMLLPKAQNVDAALRYAAKDGYEKIVVMLLPKAQNVDEALLMAMIKNHEKIFEMLLPKAQNVDEALIFAAKDGYEKIVVMLLPKAQNVDEALHMAVIKNHEKIFEMLLPKAQNVDAALVVATEHGYENIVVKLLPRAKNIDNVADVVGNIVGKGKLKSLLKYESTKDAAILFGLFRSQDWVRMLVSDQKISEQQDDPAKMTPTQRLLDKYQKTKSSRLCKFYNDTCGKMNSYPLIGHYSYPNAVVSQVIDIEKKDQVDGYTTFVHGRHWGWNYVNDVWNIIQALQKGSPTISSDISMRQRDTTCDKNQLYEYRKKLVQNGIKEEHLVSSTNDTKDERAEVTFMNYTGLSHLDGWGECSLRYVLQNHSATGGVDPFTVAQALIEKYGLQEYKDVFKKLYDQHKQASNIGELLCISVAKQKLDQIVYPAKPGGYHRGKKASEVVAVCDQKNQKDPRYFQKVTNDAPIFCAAALGIPGERPDAYKIRSVTVTNQEKYKAYVAARNALFEQLKKDKKR